MPQSLLQPSPFRVPLLDAQGQLVATWRRFFLSSQVLINDLLTSRSLIPRPGIMFEDTPIDEGWVIPGPVGPQGPIGVQGIPGMDGAETDESWWLSGFPTSSAMSSAFVFQTLTPLVALGGGVAPTLGTIGGTGPATAAQNTWLRMLDNTGVAFWVPAWK